MRAPHWLVAGVALSGVAGLTLVSWTTGQEPAQQPPAKQAAPPREEAKLPFFQQSIYRGGKSGCEWLVRANLVDGRFVPGYLPALNQAMEGDSHLRQAAAAAALARAARYYRDEEASARARQAVLRLMLETAPEEGTNPVVRSITLPPGMANRLAAAALIVQAVHELPAPASDLLDQADQLCNFIRRAQRADGSFACTEPGPDGKAVEDPEAVNAYSGEALVALMRSQQHRPAAWKLEAVRKALPYYQARWRASKNLTMTPRHAAAYTEAYLQTKDKAYADFVFEMADWVCTFQHRQLDPLHPQWVGGFMPCVDGKPAQGAPSIGTAVLAEGLVEAGRIARQVGDVTRWQRYKDTAERSLQFLTTLQYSPANTRHFAAWYQPYVVGGFHASHSDGNLRLDYTQQAVCAMVGYMMYAADTP